MSVSFQQVASTTIDTPRDVVLYRLGKINADARACTRRGYTATANKHYAELHRRINHLLTVLEQQAAAAAIEA